MTRTELNSKTNDWLMEDTQTRCAINILAETNSTGDRNVSMSCGGRADEMHDALVNSMIHHPGLGEIIEEAVDTFRAYKEEQNRHNNANNLN